MDSVRDNNVSVITSVICILKYCKMRVNILIYKNQPTLAHKSPGLISISSTVVSPTVNNKHLISVYRSMIPFSYFDSLIYVQKYNRDSKTHFTKCATGTLEYREKPRRGIRFTAGKDILHMKLKTRPDTV